VVLSDLERLIAAGSTVVLDSSAVLAYLDGTEQTSQVAALVIDGLVRPGRNPGLISAVTVTEALVRPFRVSATTPVEDFLRHFPNLTVVNIDYAIARDAARIRALTGLRTADAFVLATATNTEASTVIGNDARWRTAGEKLGDSFKLVLLSDLRAG
jgi:predicted nucleic acid-binding protein